VNPAPWLHPILALVFSPLLFGLIQRTKAVFAGRKGPPLLQPYHDLFKLLQKGAVYSRTTTWIFRAGPLIGLSAVCATLFLIPCGPSPALLSFNGDWILLVYLLGLARFFTVLAALDTGSSFEGMGASREVLFSAITEPALLLALGAAAHHAGEFSLSGALPWASVGTWAASFSVLALLAGALMIVFLAENSRIPVDDPNTHLELTMIHEVMVLDHGGPDFAFILYGSMLKLWVLGTLLVGFVAPLRGLGAWTGSAWFLGAMFALAIATGVVESTMARLRLVRVPQLLTAAGVLSTVALILVLA
jgi:formate hydrogenlyase subunit 4